jgi:hypothetical protein
MKILCAVSVFFVAAILVFGTSADEAFAGGIYGWGSAGCYRGGGGDCGYGCASWGYGCAGGGGGHSVYGLGRCGLSAASGNTYGGDYAPYVIAHGPMFPAGDSPYPAYWYAQPSAPNTSARPNGP